MGLHYLELQRMEDYLGLCKCLTINLLYNFYNLNSYLIKILTLLHPFIVQETSVTVCLCSVIWVYGHRVQIGQNAICFSYNTPKVVLTGLAQAKSLAQTAQVLLNLSLITLEIEENQYLPCPVKILHNKSFSLIVYYDIKSNLGETLDNAVET